MAKSADAFRTISEVAEWLETPAHVLRFWESKFSQVKPVKRAGGRRYYRPADMQLLGGIKQLLHEDGMTIKGVQKILRENGVKHVASLSQPLDEVTEIEASEMAVDVQPIEEAPSTADVVSFRGGEARAEPKQAPKAEAEAEAEPAPSAMAPPQPTEPVPEAEEEASAKAPPLTTEPAPEDTDAQDGADPVEAVPESAAPPVMPSFLQHHKEDAPAPETKSAMPATEAPAPPPAITLPDIPDDPEDDAACEPGPLSALARLNGKVDREALAQMQELADQLGSGPA